MLMDIQKQSLSVTGLTTQNLSYFIKLLVIQINMNKEDAIKTLKVYLNDAYTHEDLRLAIESLHPELIVSEEERTIDSLMSFLNGLSENEIPDQKMFLKWWVFLKKQKERTLEDVAKEVTKDKETAITFLKAAGIMDENGELTEMYRTEEKKEQKPAECDKETEIQKAFREGQNAGRQEVFDNPGAYGLEKIDNVFGFRIGDKVRLVDGDGRPHIIKLFEKIEGLHGPDFYRVVFEDNTASDHIIPGDEYPNGYFTCIEKIDEQKEQKPAENVSKEEHVKKFYEIKLPNREYDICNSCKLSIDSGKQKPAKWNFPYGVNETVDKLIAIAERLEMDGVCLFNGLSGTECGKFLRDLARKQVECKPVEWSEDDEKKIERIVCAIWNCETYTRQDKIEMENFMSSLHPQPKQEWSEEDERMLSRCIKSIECSKQFADSETFKNAKNKEIEWLKNRLKFLLPQPHTVSMENANKFGNLEYERGVKDGLNQHWKPTKEQLESLRFFIRHHTPEANQATAKWPEYYSLLSLYNNLKKL